MIIKLLFKITILSTFLIYDGTTSCLAQSCQSILNSYLHEGLESNLSLLKSQKSYEQQLAALKESNGRYLPSVELNARYSMARGGRAFEMPLGDIMNPAYQNLNMINQSLYADLPESSKPPTYPDVSNEKFLFFRPTEQETKIRITQAVYNPAISIDRKIKSYQLDIAENDYKTNKRFFIKEFSETYYNYLKALHISIILDNSLNLVEENKRVSTKLIENDMATKEVIFFAESKIAELVQQQATARKNRKALQAYLNLLLNRNLETPIEIPDFQYSDLTVTPGTQQETQELEEHLELTQMENYKAISEQQYRLIKYQGLPTISLVADLGFQGLEYDINSKSQYLFASIVFNWNLFSGFQNNSKLKQAALYKDIIQYNREELDQKLDMRTINASYELIEARESFAASSMRLKSSRQAFTIIRRKYEEGLISQVAYFEAQHTIQKAEESNIIAYYDILIRELHMKYVSGQPLLVEK